MLRFFDYIYYRVCKAYKTTKDSGPEFSAACVIAITQFFIVLDCFMIIAVIRQNKAVLNKPIVIIVIVFFLVFNYIRYVYQENHSYAVMKEKWEKEPNSYKRGVLILFYIIIIIVFSFGLAIYLGSKKW